MSNGAPHVVIIDYQMSNLFSVKHACEKVGLLAEVTSDPAVASRADILILPGVGAFKDAIANLRRLDLVGPTLDGIAAGKPFFGVCLGLQLLFEGSEEFGGAEGLGVLPGKVLRFPSSDVNEEPLKVPHIGWNRVCAPEGREEQWARSPLGAVDSGEFMYFVHSYYVAPSDPEHVVGVTTYGGRDFCSAVSVGNVHAVQFHPEKSGETGLCLYSRLRDLASS